MADKRISQLVDRGTVVNNDVVPIVVFGAATTNKATISSIQTFMQGNLDLGVTSVGITLGSSGTDVSVTGSPITSSGNITINIPTASASNRGVLSAADWSTFNSKQGAITLTTTGTSGAATLVSNTLNIPNYAQDLTGFVTLGTAQTITGIKTFDTGSLILAAAGTANATLFRNTSSDSSSLSNHNVIGFNNSNDIFVTTQNDGGFILSFTNSTSNKVYTLQDASGTLAFTSQIPSLAGYVTLDTVQSITAQKTFTTGGSGNTIIVNHTSGSGHGVDITKTGAGEGLRVNKVSGGGNAVTITGGLLSAEAATLTGALNGTSAVFSSNSGIIVGANGRAFIRQTIGGDAEIGAPSGGVLSFINNGSQCLSFLSTGAATFSSSVGIGTSPTRILHLSSSGSNAAIRLDNTVSGRPFILTYDDSQNLTLLNSSDSGFTAFNSGTGAGSTKLIILNNGRVGIGTATPPSKFSVEYDRSLAFVGSAIYDSQAFNASNHAGILGFGGRFNSAGAFTEWASIGGIKTNTTDGDFAGDLVAYTRPNGGGMNERMRITSAGLIYLGSDASGAGGLGVMYYGGGFANQTTLDANTRFQGPNISVAAAKAYAWNTYSDQRIKENINPLSYGLSEILQLNPVSYNQHDSEVIDGEIILKETYKSTIGLIAQEVFDLIPESVGVGNDTELWGLDYDKIVPVLIKAIQELKTEIDSLKNQIK